MPTITPGYTTPGSPLSFNAWTNHAPNGGFDFWQAIEGTATDVTTGNSTYGPDWWFLKNASGDTCTLSRATGLVNGSRFGCKAIYKAAATPTSNGMALYYIMPNFHSLQFANQSVSLSLWGIAFNLTTVIGVTFVSATTETKTMTAIGPEISIPVNTSTMTQGVLNNVPVSGTGTLPVPAGVLGVRIRCLKASTGGVFAASNGFQVEQLMLTPTPLAQTSYDRFGGDLNGEIGTIQAVYEKNFPQGTAPVSAAGAAGYNFTVFNGTGVTNTVGGTIYYRTPKRAAGTVTTYNPVSANANWRDTTNNADRTATVGTATTTGFTVSAASTVAASANVINWTADATI